jgi:penicillin-binding protein 2
VTPRRPPVAPPFSPTPRSRRGSDPGRWRLGLLATVVGALVLTLFGRLWFVQVVNGSHYRAVALNNRERTIATPAARGEILDDLGRPLVTNQTAPYISVSYTELSRQKDHGVGVLTRLAPIVGQPVADLEAKIRPCGPKVAQPCWNGSPYQPVPVLEPASPQQALAISEHSELFPGVTTGVQAVRAYPAGALAANSLGYLSPVSIADRKDPRLAQLPDSDLVGRTGLESVYDPVLRGTDGVQTVSVDHLGAVTGVVSNAPPQGGDHVVLSLDEGVQSALEHALVDAMHSSGTATTASGVVLDPKTGHIVALASVPSYDPSLFVGGISSAAYAQLNSAQAGLPLINRAVAGQYAPGSTFKIVGTTAALTSGQAGPNSIISCPTSFQVGTQNFRNFEGEGFGPMNLARALQVSCDTVFYQLAYADWQSDERKLQAKPPQPADEVFARTAREFGFGAPTGVDLTEDTAGSILDRAGKTAYWNATKEDACKGAQTQPKGSYIQQLDAENCTSGNVYRGGDAVQFAIGQGDVTVSPLQLAVAYAAVANGGTVFSPRLAKAIVDTNGKLVRTVDAPVVRHVAANPATLSYIRDALVSVVNGGTAAGVFTGLPVQVAGKTGTAETATDGDTSWFASFAPANDPQYVVVIDVPHSGQGALFAAPAVREVYDAIYGSRGVAPVLANGQLPTTLPTVAPDGTVGQPQLPAPPGAGAYQVTPAAAPGRRAGTVGP